MTKLKLFEMFAGYGGASFALKKANIPFGCVGYSEIDKYAIQCYEQNHKNVKNYGDCKIINPNDLPDFDLLTGGFPCQSFSLAGKRLGSKDKRGLLFFDIIKIAKVKKPRYMLLENVKGLLSIKHKEIFDLMLEKLDEIGYTVFYHIFNTKDFGLPQNRERVFFICFLKSEDVNSFKIPNKKELNLFLKDVLDKDVEQKYFLKEDRIKKLMLHINDKHKNDIIQLNKPRHSSQRVYDINGIAPTLTAGNNGGGKEPCKIIQLDASNIRREGKFRTYNDYSRCINTSQGGGHTPYIIHNCLTEAIGRSGSSSEFKNSCQKVYDSSLQIRKITPIECFRLMGFLKDEINLNGLSDTQKYKLAGNGWDINLVSKVFEGMIQNGS